MMKRFWAALCCLVLLCAPAWAEEADNGLADFSERFADRFLEAGAEPVVEDRLYQSANLFIEIREDRANKSDVYIADVYVRDLSLLQRAFGGGKYRTKMQTVKTIAQNAGAILALTGDNGHNFDKGVVFANGERKRKTLNRKRDVCVIYKSGEMVTLSGAEITEAFLEEHTDDIWQSFLFGPALLDEEGKALTKFSTTSVSAANPRAVIGYFEPGHYCLVQVDGRGTKKSGGSRNTGMKMTELAAYMAGLGCKAAYNLDGGQSALMWFNGKVISTPYKGGRTVGDIVCLVEPQ
ncbi:MAG: phosphodiester glycosidase family protein [Clostridia bacterium]|nr:phosphodiester glycosidase family protein [Clostridia bacterium]